MHVGNFNEDEVGVPILDTVLHAGDMLYFPRGWIHQANATHEDSVHVTVSTYQDWSWGTYLEKVRLYSCINVRFSS